MRHILFLGFILFLLSGCVTEPTTNTETTGGLGRITEYAKSKGLGSWTQIKEKLTGSTADQATNTNTSLGYSSLGYSGALKPENRLNGNQIDSLFSGKTVYSRSATDANSRQVGYFDPSLSLTVRSNGQHFSGSWYNQNDQLCVSLSAQQLCNTVYFEPPAQTWQSPTYFLVGTQDQLAGQPTVIIESFVTGNVEAL